MNPPNDDCITIQIRTSAGNKFTVGSSTTSSRISPSHTISQLKELISNHESSDRCPVERQRLIHKGRILNDNDKSLQDYGIVDSNQTIYLVKSSARVAAPAPASASAPKQGSGDEVASATSAAYGSDAASPQGPVGTAADGGVRSPFPSTNIRNHSPFLGMQGPLPTMDQLMQNPEQLSSIMNSPMMQSVMNNPDFFRSLMESNPQMRQLMDSNPELRHVLDDPELMRRSMEMMRDPSAMQNMMRNQDLAMSQIENIPGGFSALRRMYEDVQEPMMDAMASGALGAGSHNSASGNNSSSGTGGGSNENRGAAGTAMPNPWASTRSASSSGQSGRNIATHPVPNGSTSSANIMSGANPWADMGANMSSRNSGMSGNGLDLEQTLQMLENPFVNQMMNSLMSDPAAMQSILQSNPMLQQLSQSNPQIAQMMSNPEFMRSMLDPNNLRSMMQMQNAMQNLGFGVGPGGFPGGADFGSGIPGGVPPPNAGVPPGLDFSTLLNQMQAASTNGFSPSAASVGRGNSAATIPPEQRYRIQLQSLNDMGFDDNAVNIAALVQTHGNVNRAIDMLLTNPPVVAPAPSTSSNADRSDGTSGTEDNKDPTSNSDGPDSNESTDK